MVKELNQTGKNDNNSDEMDKKSEDDPEKKAISGMSKEDKEMLFKIIQKLQIKYPNTGKSQQFYFQDIVNLMRHLDEGAAIDIAELKDTYLRDKIAKILKLLPMRTKKSKGNEFKVSRRNRD